MLISSIVGVDMRATMDMDATIKGIPLEQAKLKDIINEIVAIKLDDDVSFSILNMKDIREDDEYGGYKITLQADFDGIKVLMTIDITVGDTITPKEVIYKFDLMFEERSIHILAYNLETVISEKFETVITRNIDNTRARDFYDLYILFKVQDNNIDKVLLKKAITDKFKSRQTENNLKNIDKIYREIKDSEKLRKLWNIYCKNYSYAEDISYDEVIENLSYIIDIIK